MKRSLSVLLCLIMLLALTACGEAPTESTEASGQTEPSAPAAVSQFPREDAVGLEYAVNEDGISCTVTGIGTCTDTAISIGAQIDGYTVTAIADHAFFRCTELTGISFSESIETVGAFAFYGCSAMTEVRLNGNLQNIGQYAFAYCSAMTEIAIPAAVEKIGEWAFYYCPGLTGVYITDMERWCAIEFSSVYANPLRYAGDLYCNGELITELTLPETVLEIKNWAFEGCTSLQKVVLHDQLQGIGERAFRDCKNLTKIHYAGSREQWREVPKGANWNASISTYTIFCSDGEIRK